MPVPTTPGDRFAADVNRYIEEFGKTHPESATSLGITTFDSLASDVSAAGWTGQTQRDKYWLATFDRYKPGQLNDTQQIDQQLLLTQLRSSIATADYAPWKRDPTLYMSDGTFELFMHGNRSEAEATDAAIARLANVPNNVAAGIANLNENLASKVLITERGIPSIRAQAEFVRDELPTFVKDPALRARLAEAGAKAAESYDRFAKYLDGFGQRAHGDFAFGEKRYNAVLQQGEGLNYDARSLRELGRAQFKEINAEMEDLAQQIWGSRDWRAHVSELQEKRPTSMDDLVARYRAETERARQFVIDHNLMTVPPDERAAVEPAPGFLRSSISVASYFPPPAFGPKAQGTFNVPVTPDGATPEQQEQRLKSNADYMIPSVTAHETYPGHHLHWVEAEGSDALRQMLNSTYFIEGWALYVEKMMDEQGFYRDPAERLGYLNMRLFRAARIIVDTSLHLNEMSFDEAVKFMGEKVGFPEDTARGEVRRYASWPTQASAYLTGALEIDRLSKQWQAEGKGTLREFNDAITSAGKLPLGVAAAAIGLAPRLVAPPVTAHALGS